VIDPRETRSVLGLCLAVIDSGATRPVEPAGTGRFGVFRM
jgi:acyl-CoA carboxylase subunit beta